MLPFAIVGYWLADMLAVLTQPPHQPTEKFVNLSQDAEESLAQWVDATDKIFTRERDRDAWAENCGAAEGWIRRLALTPRRALLLVRCCNIENAPSRFISAVVGPSSLTSVLLPVGVPDE